MVLSILVWSIAFISFLLSYFYFNYVRSIHKNWMAMPNFSIDTKVDSQQLSVAVLIAARNEASNIKACVSSVLSNDYTHLELIVVDDHSEDNTANIIATFEDPRLKVLNQSKDISGKKKALELGISTTAAELIITLDADCVVGQDFIAAIVSKYLKTGFDAMAGPVKIEDEGSLISSFQQLDVSGTMAVNAYGIAKRKYFLSNGANFVFRKKCFDQVSGYKGNDHIASGDDLFLIQKIAQLPESKIVFLKSEEALVVTKGQDTFKNLLGQRRRWASKSSAYQDQGLKILLASIFLFHFFILLNLVCSIFLGKVFVFIALSMMLIKVFVDYFFLKDISLDFGTGRAMRKYLMSSLMSLGMVVYSGFVAIFPGTYIWKGRRLK